MTPQSLPRLLRLIAAVLTLTLVAAACTSDSGAPTVSGDEQPTSTAEATSTTAEATTTTTEAATTSTAPAPLINTVDWTACGELECATVTVPADYNDPSAGAIDLAVNMLRASDTDRRIGILMVNPGGPGAPGTGLTESFLFGGFPEEITERFDVVGFDPRGVGDSEPAFGCGESGDQLAVLADVEDIYDTPEEIAAGEAAVQLCVDTMGALAGRIHTDFVVRDMNEIRMAMGEEQISYLGYSYGSLIGVWYATLFPDTVRAMVIDGADNPLDEVDTFEERLESTREEIKPIEDLLAAALAACGDASCPIYNNGDPTAYYFDTAKKFDLINEANADNPDTAFLALITPLYNEASWPRLWTALADLQERDDPAVFSDLATFQLGDDPGRVNDTAHINCLDSWALRPENDRETRFAEAAEFFAIEDQLNAEFPLLAAIESGSSGTCAFYDSIAPKPLAIPLDGGGVPILVVGNTSDPVTSFGESEELANDILSNGILLKVDHASHTVYPSNACVNAAVNDVLLDASYPTDVIECDREELDVGAILNDTCLDLLPQVPTASDVPQESYQELCDRFVAASFERLGEDAVYDALFGEDEDAAAEAGAAVFQILTEEIDAQGS